MANNEQEQLAKKIQNLSARLEHQILKKKKKKKRI